MTLELFYPKFPFWRAEVSRLALYLGGIPFENRHPSFDEIRAMKERGELPFGQVPALRVNDRTIGQTGAIARFCGKLSGHYPTDDPLSAALIDQIIDAATDITVSISPTMREKDPKRKAEMRAELASEVLPRWFGHLSRLLEQNGGSGFFVGDNLSIADLAIWRLMGWIKGGHLDGIPDTILNGHPLLEAHYDIVDSIPEIRQWMADQYGK